MTVNHNVSFEPQIPAEISQEHVRRRIPPPIWLNRLVLDRWQALKTRGAWLLHDVDITYHKSLEASEYLGERPLYLITKFANHTYDEVDLARDEEQFFMFGKETNRSSPEEFMRENEEMLMSFHERYVCVHYWIYRIRQRLSCNEVLRQQRFSGLSLCIRMTMINWSRWPIFNSKLYQCIVYAICAIAFVILAVTSKPLYGICVRQFAISSVVNGIVTKEK